MHAVASSQLDLAVERVAHLFQPREPDPWGDTDVAVTGRSAFDLAIESWLVGHSGPPSVLNVRFLSNESGEEESRRRRDLPAAFAHYCSARKKEARVRLALIRRRGRRAALLGFGLLLACNALAGILDSGALPLPALLSSSLSEALTVLGWVALWLPIESFFIAPLELRRELRFLEGLAHAELRLASSVQLTS